MTAGSPPAYQRQHVAADRRDELARFIMWLLGWASPAEPELHEAYRIADEWLTREASDSRYLPEGWPI